MKICYIITDLEMGGAETQVIALAKSLHGRGNKIVFIVLTGEGLAYPLPSGIFIVRLNMRKTLCSFLESYFKARRVLEKFKPDVIHSHMIHANIFARLLRISTPMKRLVCTAHNTNEGGWFRMLAYRCTDIFADLSTNVSQEAVDRFVSVGAVRRRRMIAVYNGIDTNSFIYSDDDRYRVRTELNIGDDAKLLLSVGRLVKEKDYPNLLLAFSRVVKKKEHIKLAIVGEGRLRSELYQKAKNLGIEANVIFLGIRHDIPAVMCACDLFILPSEYEGFALVVAEAMSCGRIIIATDCGGVAEVVGEDGFLVPIHDSQHLALAIQEGLCLSIAERKRRSEMARARILQKYSLESAINRWLDIYIAS
jgi:glycosyltransferase involved in cell wall biosynthesis